ncbi:hypothetical protein A3Q56_01383 [Intoshia linei]|uniref:Uncharacterized protein n=1 Tax=Intoshia linei TaxID=1819745 RepID=A0A177B9F1_9BILA|nr:hypothetical protein A3Q56_01383 [Intoshia linei]
MADRRRKEEWDKVRYGEPEKTKILVDKTVSAEQLLRMKNQEDTQDHAILNSDMRVCALEDSDYLKEIVKKQQMKQNEIELENEALFDEIKNNVVKTQFDDDALIDIDQILNTEASKKSSLQRKLLSSCIAPKKKFTESSLVCYGSNSDSESFYFIIIRLFLDTLFQPLKLTLLSITHDYIDGRLIESRMVSIPNFSRIDTVKILNKDDFDS